MDHRQRVRVPALARLLAARDEQVRRVLRSEGIELRFDSVEWGEAAAYLFDAWPRAQLIDRLGPELADVVPSGFHPSRVGWRIPIFIVQAMEHQAALMHGNDPRVNGETGGRFTSPAVDDYVADILFSEIDPSTAAALASKDPAFAQAFHYPLFPGS